MSVYMIVDAKEILDRQKYGEYIQKVPQTIAKIRYHSREGDNHLGTPDYRLVAPLREQSARGNAVVVEGI